MLAMTSGAVFDVDQQGRRCMRYIDSSSGKDFEEGVWLGELSDALSSQNITPVPVPVSSKFLLIGAICSGCMDAIVLRRI